MHAMTAAQTAENHGDEWELNWYSHCGIYFWFTASKVGIDI